MREIPRCSRCILPASLPSVKLNESNVCTFCTSYERKLQAWDRTKATKASEFEALLKKARHLDRPYDCLIPLSGGKDSTYALYIAAKTHNLKCLCVTFDNGYLSEFAKSNIRNAVDSTNSDHIYYTINPNTLKSLYRLFLLKSGTFCPVCLRGIGLATRFADRFDIPLVISGNGWRVQYLSNIPELYQGGDAAFFENIVRGEPIENDVRHMARDRKPDYWNVLVKITSRLTRLPVMRGRHYIRLYDYVEPDFDRIYAVIGNEMNWRRPEDKTEHMDCRLHEIAHYIHTLKFPDITQQTVYYSGRIRSGHITRAAALESDQSIPDDPVDPDNLDSFLGDIGLGKDAFLHCVGNWRNIERYRDSGRHRLKSLYNRFLS